MRDLGATRLYIATHGQWQCMKNYLRINSTKDRLSVVLWWHRGGKIAVCISRGTIMRVLPYNPRLRKSHLMRQTSSYGWRSRYARRFPGLLSIITRKRHLRLLVWVSDRRS